MRIVNETKLRLPFKWFQGVMDLLGVNPQVFVCYSDDPEVVKVPNYKQMIGHRMSTLDGMATDNNTVILYVGKWKDGVHCMWTPEYLKWMFAHEARHQYYFYKKGNYGYRWRNMSLTEVMRREELACNRFANKMVGHPDIDFPTYKTKRKRKRAV